MITVVEPKAKLVTPVSHLADYTKLIEQAGRTCYKSEERITNESAERFIRQIIRRGHESVIEHCSVTFRITCSRACSHQLVRHRIAAYSQESQRYCDYSKSGEDLGLQIIMPPSMNKLGETRGEFRAQVENAYDSYVYLRDKGVPPEDARFLLPNACKTEVVTTFNLRMWRHVLEERWLNKHAQWEIRKVMNDIAYELNHYLPVFFQDIVDRMQLDVKGNIIQNNS
jgi:thymidylate synthase (FAD)